MSTKLRTRIPLNKQNKYGSRLAAVFLLFLVAAAQAASAEEEGHGPQTAQGDHGVKNAGYHAACSEDPCHQVKVEDTHQTPVDAAYDAQNQCQNIHKIPLPSLSCLDYL